MKNLKNLTEEQIQSKITEISDLVFAQGKASSPKEAYQIVSSAYFEWTQGNLIVGDGAFISLEESIIKSLLKHNYDHGEIPQALRNAKKIFGQLNNESIKIQ